MAIDNNIVVHIPGRICSLGSSIGLAEFVGLTDSIGLTHKLIQGFKHNYT